MQNKSTPVALPKFPFIAMGLWIPLTTLLLVSLPGFFPSAVWAGWILVLTLFVYAAVSIGPLILVLWWPEISAEKNARSVTGKDVDILKALEDIAAKWRQRAIGRFNCAELTDDAAEKLRMEMTALCYSNCYWELDAIIQAFSSPQP